MEAELPGPTVLSEDVTPAGSYRSPTFSTHCPLTAARVITAVTDLMVTVLAVPLRTSITP